MRPIGIDLGTSDTYIYECISKDNIAPLSFSGESKPGCIETVILYDENNRPLGIGHEAKYEYARRKSTNCVLHSQFKPELNSNPEEVSIWMTDFLKLLGDRIDKHTICNASKICVGIPSRIRSDYSLQLEKCFANAGWPGQPILRFVKESEAALASCIMKNAQKLSNVNESILILDFGGGTCDYSVMHNGESVESGSDRLFGGRIFDDLFYQVFIKKSEKFRQYEQDSASSPKYTVGSYYNHWIQAKTKKEEFSNNVFEKNGTGISVGISWTNGDKKEWDSFSYSKDEFLHDISAYTASKDMLEIVSVYKNKGQLSQFAKDFIDGKEISLVDWLKSIFDMIHKRQSIKKVVLTGGSCKWFFVRDEIEKYFNAECILSNSPFEDVARGLAIYDSIQEDLPKLKNLLDNSSNDFLLSCKDGVKNEFEKFKLELVDAYSNHFVNNIEQILAKEENNVQDNSVELIANKIYESIKNDKTFITSIYAKVQTFNSSINSLLTSATEKWFEQNKVFLPPIMDFNNICDMHNIIDAYTETSLLAAKEIRKLFEDKIPNWAARVAAVLALGVACVDFGGGFLTGLAAGGGAVAAYATSFGLSRFAQNKTINIRGKSYGLVNVLLHKKVRNDVLKSSRKFMKEKLDKSMTNKAFETTLSNVQSVVENNLSILVSSLHTLNYIKPVN